MFLVVKKVKRGNALTSERSAAFGLFEVRWPYNFQYVGEDKFQVNISRLEVEFCNFTPSCLSYNQDDK